MANTAGHKLQVESGKMGVKRAQQRPYSGHAGIQKMMKSDLSKHRVQAFNKQNFDMYNNKAPGGIAPASNQQSKVMAAS